MPKQPKTLLTLLSLLLFTPVIAFAECGFAHEDATMTIVVSKQAKSCFSSTSFREAFKASINAALNEDSVISEPSRKRFDDRSTRGEKLWTLAERRHQATMPTGRYYGAKP